MKLIALPILLMLSVFLIAISGAACTSAPSASVIPHGWKEIDAGSFSFALPPAMRGGEKLGTDSALWKYQGDGVHLVIELSQNPSDLSLDLHEPGYKDEAVEIDGHKAKIATFQLSASRGAYFPNEGKYVAAAHFPDTDGFATKMTLWATCEDPARQEIAKQIFLTLNIK